MKEKLSLPGDLKVRQEPWSVSPCSECSRTPCCRNLPLASSRLDSRIDFINLALLSCYNGIYPALKRSGEWIIYLKRDCAFLDGLRGKCTIHAEQHQSAICKSYDSHQCWYVDAFNPAKYTQMIPFNTEMLVWFEEHPRPGLQYRGTDREWDDLCDEAFRLRQGLPDDDRGRFEPCNDFRLPFKKSRQDHFLFFPPFSRPEYISHFELLSFRLGFPGVYLAVSDSCWAFLVKTELNPDRLDYFRRNAFPGIEHKDGDYSFNGMMKKYHPYTESGDQWVVLGRTELGILKYLTDADPSGRIRRLPSCRAILDALNSYSPDKVA